MYIAMSFTVCAQHEGQHDPWLAVLSRWVCCHQHQLNFIISVAIVCFLCMHSNASCLEPFAVLHMEYTGEQSCIIIFII